VGHSLGGAAVLAAAIDLPDVKAVVTIGAPADAEHVVASFQDRVPTIEAQGEASVQLAGRHFTIRRQFLEDVRAHRLERAIAALHRPLLVLHAPMDEVVGLDNARRIFDAARHPKSFVSLDGADHLLTRREDAAFVADIVSGWCSRYIAVAPVPAGGPAPEGVRVRATGKGRFQQAVEAGPHRLLADEPERDGGLGSGPSPYDLLSAGLAACTAMTMRLYADRRGWRLPPFTVEVRHDRVHADDCESCIDGATGQVDRFTRTIAFDRELEGEARAKILEIAGKCPVHRTLESRSTVATTIETRADAGSG
jgi:putative redox protein